MQSTWLTLRSKDGAEGPLTAWQGPSVSIDTACSSSLVGTHLAATSFLSADCPRALVCGVNLTMRAETTAVLSKAGMLAQVTPQYWSHLPAHNQCYPIHVACNVMS